MTYIVFILNPCQSEPVSVTLFGRRVSAVQKQLMKKRPSRIGVGTKYNGRRLYKRKEREMQRERYQATHEKEVV